MKLAIAKGSTSVTVNLFIQDSTSATGAGKTGLAYNTASLTAYYVRQRGSATAITLATQTVTGAYSSGGFVEIDATNMPGWYRLDIPDAALASGADFVGVHLQGASGMAPLPLEIQLTGVDLNNATTGGLSNLDAAISTRSTYAGADTAGTTTLLSRITGAVPLASDYTPTRAAALDNLDATVSSRSTYAGGAVASVTAPVDLSASSVSAVQSGLATESTLLTVAGYIDTEVAAIKAKTDNLPASPAATGDIPSASAIASATWSATLTESYAADGAAFTGAQALYMLWAMQGEKAISGATLTAKKLDGSTAAMTFTLDSAIAPASIARAS